MWRRPGERTWQRPLLSPHTLALLNNSAGRGAGGGAVRAAGMGFTQVEGPRANGPPGPQASSWPPQPCELLLQLTLPISEATPLCARPHPTNQEHWRETDTSQKERRAILGGGTEPGRLHRGGGFSTALGLIWLFCGTGLYTPPPLLTTAIVTTTTTTNALSIWGAHLVLGSV